MLKLAVHIVTIEPAYLVQPIEITHLQILNCKCLPRASPNWKAGHACGFLLH